MLIQSRGKGVDSMQDQQLNQGETRQITAESATLTQLNAADLQTPVVCRLPNLLRTDLFAQGKERL